MQLPVALLALLSASCAEARPPHPPALVAASAEPAPERDAPRTPPAPQKKPRPAPKPQPKPTPTPKPVPDGCPACGMG
jgi:hypothetical protein